MFLLGHWSGSIKPSCPNFQIPRAAIWSYIPCREREGQALVAWVKNSSLCPSSSQCLTTTPWDEEELAQLSPNPQICEQINDCYWFKPLWWTGLLHKNKQPEHKASYYYAFFIQCISIELQRGKSGQLISGFGFLSSKYNFPLSS